MTTLPRALIIRVSHILIEKLEFLILDIVASFDKAKSYIEGTICASAVLFDHWLDVVSWSLRNIYQLTKKFAGVLVYVTYSPWRSCIHQGLQRST